MKPARVSAGRARKGRKVRGYLLIRSALPALRFEGLDSVSSLLHRASHEPADGMALPCHCVHDLGQSSSVLALEHSNHLGGLTALARCTGFLRLGSPLALGVPKKPRIESVPSLVKPLRTDAFMFQNQPMSRDGVLQQMLAVVGRADANGRGATRLRRPAPSCGRTLCHALPSAPICIRPGLSSASADARLVWSRR
jgi:hypothetical protein